MNKCTIIVDPQNDFIIGSLKVPFATEAMDNLARYILNGEAGRLCITLDWHPETHCSFKTFPSHCVQHTAGAAIYQPIVDSIDAQCLRPLKLTKGTVDAKNEFSVLENHFSGGVLKRELERYGFDEIEVCGLAGDICVLSTIKDLMKLGYTEKIVVITSCIASLDEGEKLNKFIEEHNLKTK